MNNKKEKELLKKISKKEPRNKGVTIKVTNSEYEKITKFCRKNNIKISELLRIKIEEILSKIN